MIGLFCDAAATLRNQQTATWASESGTREQATSCTSGNDCIIIDGLLTRSSSHHLACALHHWHDTGNEVLNRSASLNLPNPLSATQYKKNVNNHLPDFSNICWVWVVPIFNMLVFSLSCTQHGGDLFVNKVGSRFLVTCTLASCDPPCQNKYVHTSLRFTCPDLSGPPESKFPCNPLLYTAARCLGYPHKVHSSLLSRRARLTSEGVPEQASVFCCRAIRADGGS